MSRRLAIAIAVASVLLGASPHGSHIASRESPVTQNRVVESLEQYRRGDFDSAVDRLMGSRKARSVVGEFRSGAGGWIDRAPVTDRHARTLVAAAMSVEVMAASFLQHFFDYGIARELVEWSCSRLKKFPAVDAERWIHLAFIALAQGARDDSLLTGTTLYRGAHLPSPGAHAEHAGLRFPSEGRFALAFVTGPWQAQQIASFPLTPYYLNKQTYGRFEIDDYETPLLDATLRLLAALFDDPRVGAEARLRSGVLKFMREDTAAARVDLLRATSADDASVRSLAHLMLGTIADQADDGQEALARFRLAYEAVPSTSASVTLAARLYRFGRTDEATAVLKAFEAAPPRPDPWELYGQRDFRFYGAYREQVRRAVLK